MRIPALKPGIFVTVLLAIAASLHAQGSGSSSQTPNQQPGQPTQPQQPATPADANKDANKDKDQPPVPPVVAGTSQDAPLTGASQPIIGLVSSRSYVLPSVFYYGQLDSNGANVFGGGSFTFINSIMGSIAIQKVGRASQLNLGYLIGRSFSNHGGVFDSTTHELAASELWSRGRWDGFIFDKFLYSSQASLLGGETPFQIIRLNEVAGLADTGPVILRNTFLPGQGVFTAFGPRLSNALVAQVNNHLSRRTFFTLVGNYNKLSFFNSNLVDSSSAGIQAGVGYQRSRRDTFAVVYRYNDFWFDQEPVKVHDHVVEAAYQRQLSERLLLQLGAGPEVSFINAPDVTGATVFSTTRTSWTVDTLLRYQLRRTLSVYGGYDHYLTGGGGFFLAAVTDRANIGVTRQLSHEWRLDVTASYAHNRNLIPLTNVFGPGTSVPSDASFDSVYGGFEMRRRVGRDSDLFFGYLGRYQTASFRLCEIGICKGTSLVGHQFNFGFAWRLRPVPLG
jgi:hypothetical protein